MSSPSVLIGPCSSPLIKPVFALIDYCLPLSLLSFVHLFAFLSWFRIFLNYIMVCFVFRFASTYIFYSVLPIIINKGNTKITELRTILQRESQNS